MVQIIEGFIRAIKTLTLIITGSICLTFIISLIS